MESAKVIEVIKECGFSVTFPLLVWLHERNIFENELVDSFSLGKACGDFIEGIEENMDLTCMMNLVNTISNPNKVPIVKECEQSL